MSASLADAVFALDAAWPVSLRSVLGPGVWPALPPAPDGSVPVRGFVSRYAEAGAALRALEAGGPCVWSQIDRAALVDQARIRLRDSGVISQTPTDFCGPLAVVVEFARRRPADFVRGVTELVEKGQLTTPGGAVVAAEDELREQPVPSGPIRPIDWLLAATMRDAANLWEDVENAKGLEALTLWPEMAYWTRNLLGLGSTWETTFAYGELDAIRAGQQAIDAGGVAFLLIDSDLIKDGSATGETEEDMHWECAPHRPGQPVGPFGAVTHSRDDDLPDHWIVFLGDLALGDDDGPIALRVWSWGCEFRLTGSADGFGEYLFAVVTGRP